MTNSDSKPMAAWKSLAQDVLTVLLQDTGAQMDHWLGAGGSSNDFPAGQHRQLYNALFTLRQDKQYDGRVIPPTIVIDELDAAVNVQWLTETYALYSEVLESAFGDMCPRLRERGRQFALHTALAVAQQQIELGEDLQQVQQGVMDAASQHAGATAIDTSAAAMDARLTERYQNPESTVRLKWGQKWLDKAAPHFCPGDVVVIAGAYKGRKSSYARNMTLANLRAGHTVLFASFENNALMVYSELVAMVATQWMIRRGYDQTVQLPIQIPQKTSGGETQMMSMSVPALSLGGRGIYNGARTRDHWHNMHQEAIEYAREMVGGKWGDRLHLIGMSQDDGGAVDLPSLQNQIISKRRKYGAQLVVVDYLGKVPVPGAKDIYHQTQAISLSMQSLAKQHEIAVVEISQLNEATVQVINRGQTTGNSGLKGGGDIAAAADYVVYSVPQEDGTLRLILYYSRHAASGKDHYTTVEMNGSSGLITNTVLNI